VSVVSKEAIDYMRNLKHESGKGDGAEVKNFCLRFMTDVLIRSTLSAESGAFKDDKNVFMEAGESMIGDFISFFVVLVRSFAPKLAPYLGIRSVTQMIFSFFFFAQERACTALCKTSNSNLRTNFVFGSVY